METNETKGHNGLGKPRGVLLLMGRGTPIRAAVNIVFLSIYFSLDGSLEATCYRVPSASCPHVVPD